MFFLGLSIIAIGAVFLLKNTGILTVGAWLVIWPLLVVIIGTYLLIIARRFHQWVDRMWRMAEKVEEKILHPFD